MYVLGAGNVAASSHLTDPYGGDEEEEDEEEEEEDDDVVKCKRVWNIRSPKSDVIHKAAFRHAREVRLVYILNLNL